MAQLSLRWRGQGRAEALAFGRDELVVRSTVAAAPGTPLEGELELPDPLSLTLKVRRCRREPEGSFRIEGRLVSPTRALREVLGQNVGALADAQGREPEGARPGPLPGEAGHDRGEQ